MAIPLQKPLKVLIIGDSCVDKYFYGVCERLSPEAPVPILKHIKTDIKNGMALNVLENFNSFDVQAEIITNEQTITKERFIDIKSKSHLLRFDHGENKRLQQISIDKIKRAGIEDFNAVVLVDYDKGTLEKENICYISTQCKNGKIPLFVDSKKEDLSWYENSIIKINNIEEKRVKKYPLEHELIVTYGKSGARYIDTLYKTTPVEVHDVCGAGDTFFASLIFKYLLTNNLSKSIKFANECARITVTKSGVYAPTKEDLNNENICF